MTSNIPDTKRYAVMATYPLRRNAVAKSIETLISQVDEIVLVANEFTNGELDGLLPPDVHIVIPSRDLKDVGKFSVEVEPNSFVFLCDDDILYPENYAERMTSIYQRYEHLRPVIGLHGVTYSDFFDGTVSNRLVNVFHRRLDSDRFVNQLGTGTVLCRGYQLPPLSYMIDSAKYVDLRFAVHCHNSGYPRICIQRDDNWLSEITTGQSLFDNFTKSWPATVVRECQAIAGLRTLPQAQLLSGTQLSGIEARAS